MKKLNLLSILCIGIAGLSQAQLPTEYLTKVTYFEDKTVTYEMKDSQSIDCLNILELSEYHGFKQEFLQTEIIDPLGYMHFQTDYIYEFGVRDAWMESYDRILINNNTMTTYDANGNILYTEPVEASDAVQYSPVQAANYKLDILDQNFLLQLQDSFVAKGFPVMMEGEILSVETDSFHYLFDNQSKSYLYSAYEASAIGGPAQKTLEIGMSFQLNEDGVSYSPKSKNIVEWFLSDSGCCIRKTTSTNYNGWSRLSDAGNRTIPDNADKKSSPNPSDNTISINSIAGASSFIVEDAGQSNMEYQVDVYNTAGQLIYEGKVVSGEVVQLNYKQRTGMYLVHVYDKNKGQMKVGKIILTQDGPQF